MISENGNIGKELLSKQIEFQYKDKNFFHENKLAHSVKIKNTLSPQGVI